jgi:heme exporter protein CcmD
MNSFLNMDGYGLYIWLSYALSFAFVIGTAAHSWQRARQHKKTAD